MEILENLIYTKEHEWLRAEGNKIYIGITDFAQSELGDIIFVEALGTGDSVEMGASIGTIEAVKTVADVYSPIPGKIIEVNTMLEDQPELINTDPYGDGWISCIESSTLIDSIETLTLEEYLNFIGK